MSDGIGPPPCRRLGVFQFFLPPPVAALLDEIADLFQFLLVAEQAGAVQVDVGHEQAHVAARGDLPGFVQVVAGGSGVVGDGVEPDAGEEGAGDEVLRACGAEAVDGGGEFLNGLG